MEHRCRSLGDIEACVRQAGKHRCRIEVGRLFLEGVGHDPGLGLAGGKDNRHAVFVVCYRVESYRDDRFRT